MRLVTWNAGRGRYESKAALIDDLKPSIAVIQEIAKPKTRIPGCYWFGDNPQQGVAVIAREPYRLDPLPQRDNVPKFIVPFAIYGPRNFVLFAVWTLGKQSMKYVRAASSAVDAYADLFSKGAVVMMGDFNSNAVWDTDHPAALNHSALVERLGKHGLNSAYHHVQAVSHGREMDATFHLYRHKDKPYHIDYCFLPLAWTGQIRGVEIGSYETWCEHSDHLPLIVDLDELRP